MGVEHLVFSDEGGDGFWWLACSVEGCKNLACRAANSDKCHVHTFTKLHHKLMRFLRSVLPNSKALPSDLDFILERNSKFLVAEFKRDGEQISGGQRILLRNLAKMPCFTVLLIQGYSENKNLVIEQFWQITQESKLKKAGNSLEDFIAFYRLWYSWAND